MLLLFDIDGTLLLRAFHEHREALHAAISAVFGVSDPDGYHVEAAGRTDLEIARLILLDAGFCARRIDDGMEDLRAAACEDFARRCPADMSEHVAPGVPGALEELAGRAGVRLSLVTGNLEPIARLKLERAGLGRWFPSDQGGFGSDSEDRTALPAIARARAGHSGTLYPRQRTIVIGDTPRDIACARADRVHCVAVATGPFAAEELGAADAVARRAGELPGLIEELAVSGAGAS